MQAIPEWHAPAPAQFHGEIVPLARPAVLRGIAGEWPLVKAALAGDDALVAMLGSRASRLPIDIVRTGPEHEGRFHYAEDERSFNFVRGRTDLATFLAALIEQKQQHAPFALAAQGLLADDVVPGFNAAHPMPHLPEPVPARLWIGNAARVATHNDPSDNLAIVAAGRRRFTLFPPDQIGNLYIGPVDHTPAGTPISMVHLTAPDFQRYPRFAEALATAQVAELGPGDAIFIPYGWYHHVEALDPLNILVNYWWNGPADGVAAPWDAMLHAMLAVRDLPDHQRVVWRAAFDHYVFHVNGDPAAHIHPDAAGLLGPMTAERREAIADRLEAVARRLRREE